MGRPGELATKALDVFHAGGPYGIPVDPVQIARSLGINVFSSKLDNNVSGMIAKLSEDGDVNIFLNSEHAAVRQRFACAHELGHYFANQELPDAESRTYVHRRDSLSACGTDGEEIFANQFAAQLLMPAAEVGRLRAVGFDRLDLASRFNVSLDAMTLRLKNLGLT